MLPSPPNPDGTGIVPATPQPPAPLDAIDAELQDHLASAAESLELQGISPAEAHSQAEQRFGDLTSVARRCFWIQHGDALMFRGALVTLLVVLCLGLGVTAALSWQAQRRTAERISALTEQLKLLAERPPPAPAEPAPLEIFGRAYVGSPDKPAKNTLITIVDLKDGALVRRVGTDPDGNFRSGPLGGGDYSLLAETGTKLREDRYPRLVQSAPILVYPGSPIEKPALDIAYHSGQLALELSRPLPSLEVAGRYRLDSRLMVRVRTSQLHSLPWINVAEAPLAWPVYPAYAGQPSTGTGSISRSTAREAFEVLSQDEANQLSHSPLGSMIGQLPAGKVEVAAAVVLDVFPIGYEKPNLPKIGGFPVPPAPAEKHASTQKWSGFRNTLTSNLQPASLRQISQAFDLKDDHHFWFTKGLGAIWLAHLAGKDAEPQPSRPYVLSPLWLALPAEAAFAIESGRVTRLRVEIPEDLASRVRDAIDNAKSPEEFGNVALGTLAAPPFTAGKPDPLTTPSGTPETSPFFRPVKLTVAAIEPLPAPEAQAAGR